MVGISNFVVNGVVLLLAWVLFLCGLVLVSMIYTRVVQTIDKSRRMSKVRQDRERLQSEVDRLRSEHETMKVLVGRGAQTVKFLGEYVDDGLLMLPKNEDTKRARVLLQKAYVEADKYNRSWNSQEIN